MRLPRCTVSLAARTALLVLAVAMIAEAATFSIIFRSLRSKHMQQTTQYIAGQIRLMQRILPTLDSAQRQALAHVRADESALRVRQADDVGETLAASDGFIDHLRARLQENLGEAVEIRRSARRHHELWIGFGADGERWWLVLPPFEPPEITPDLALRLAAALAALLLVAGLFVRGITRPLKRLGEAVTATGDGQAVLVDPQGPSEIRQLAGQHNRMVAQLAQAESERREMLAGLTHDLRAPLARLRVRLALLDDETALAGLNRDAEDMERIVAQCLAFLRSEADENRADPPLPVADAISDAVARQRELGRPVTMFVDAEAASAQVAIARGKLQRVFDNLIDNALQYGAPPVEVHLAIERAGMLALHVRDHGPGIPPEQRQHVLEAFVQGESARATGGNCGLGLAIVRRIVLGCQGEISLDDAPGGGLNVTVKLPLCRDFS